MRSCRDALTVAAEVRGIARVGDPGDRRPGLGARRATIQLELGEPDLADATARRRGARAAARDGAHPLRPDARAARVPRGRRGEGRPGQRAATVSPDDVRSSDRRRRRGLGATYRALLDAGDEILVPDPGWPNCGTLAVVCGAVPVGYPLDRGERTSTRTTTRSNALYGPRTRDPRGQLAVEPHRLGLRRPTQLTRLLGWAARHGLVGGVRRVLRRDVAGRPAAVRRRGRAAAAGGRGAGARGGQGVLAVEDPRDDRIAARLRRHPARADAAGPAGAGDDALLRQHADPVGRGRRAGRAPGPRRGDAATTATAATVPGAAGGSTAHAGRAPGGRLLPLAGPRRPTSEHEVAGWCSSTGWPWRRATPSDLPAQGICASRWHRRRSLWSRG